MEPIRLLRNTYLRAYLHALRENGVNPSPLLIQHRIPADFEFLTDYMLPSTLMHRFIQSAVDTSTPGAISIAAGLYNAAHQPNPFSDTVKKSGNLGEAIERHNANVIAYSPDNRFDLKITDTIGRWRKLGRSPTPETETFCVANLIGHVRTVVGKEWRPQRIGVAVANPTLLRKLALLSEVPVRKQPQHTCITLPARLLNRASGVLKGAQHEFRGTASEFGNADFLSTLRATMASYARTGDLSIDTVAAAAGTSRRTLQRRLTGLGVSYTTLADQIRFELASDLLVAKPELGVTQIGYELGYRDPGSFSRAFRRRAGMSPITYRRRFTGDSFETNSLPAA
jgi:AraC-like DNA-binding protein